MSSNILIRVTRQQLPTLMIGVDEFIVRWDASKTDLFSGMTSNFDYATCRLIDVQANIHPFVFVGLISEVYGSELALKWLKIVSHVNINRLFGKEGA